MTTTTTTPPQQDREQEFWEIVQNLDEPSNDDGNQDCPACYTKRTRPCPCGGRIHNQKAGPGLLEACSVCDRLPDGGWKWTHRAA